MNQRQKWVLQSALIGSLLLSIFGFFVVPAKATIPPRAEGLVEVPGVELGAGKADTKRAPGCELSERFPASVFRWCDWITRYADKHQLAPELIAAIMVQESGGDPLAYSHSGAVGLMQVMPRDGRAAGFQCRNGPCFHNRPTIEELQDPQFNIAYGVDLLAGMLARSGDIREALRSYGPMDVGYTYADKVLAIWDRYGEMPRLP